MAAESTMNAGTLDVPFSSMCVENLGVQLRSLATTNTNGTNETECKQLYSRDSSRLPDDRSSLVETDASTCSISPAGSGQTVSGVDDNKTGTYNSKVVGENGDHSGPCNLTEDEDQPKEDTASGRAHGGGDAGANKNQPNPEKSKSSIKFDSSDPGKPAAVHMEYNDGRGATYKLTIPGSSALDGHVQMGSNNNMTIFNDTRMSGGTSTRSSGSGRGVSSGGGRGGPTPKPAEAKQRKIVVPNREVTSLDLQTVAREITRCWKPVARYLGVSESQIETVRIDNGMESVEEVAYQMLRGWHLRTGTTATVQKLAIALQNAGQLSIVEKHLTTSANP